MLVVDVTAVIFRELLVIVISELLVTVILLLDKTSTIGFEDKGDPTGASGVDAGGGQNERVGLPTDLRLKEIVCILGFCNPSVKDCAVETDVNELPIPIDTDEGLL